MVEQVFLPPERLVNTYCRCIMLTKGEGGGSNGQRKFYVEIFLGLSYIMNFFSPS